MTTLDSPEVQAIFAELHALGVTPEQAAAGVRDCPTFKVGDRVRVARKVEATEQVWEWWPFRMDATIGEIGEVTKVEYGGRCVAVRMADERTWHYDSTALDLLEATP